MMLLQVTEAVQTISAYDDSKIVVGIIICFSLITGALYLFQKYGAIKLTGLQAIEVTKVMMDKIGTQNVEISAPQAMKITTDMINELLQTPVDGHSAEKRISKMHHDVTAAIENHGDITEVLVTISKGQDKFMEMVGDHYKKSIELQEKYLKELIKNK